jgi:uncharacterized protein YndB with AHSA1/START domain
MSATLTLPHRLDRTVVIQAEPETVFRFFTDSTRWARWWGAGSTIEPRAGGDLYIRHPGNVESRGNVVSIEAPRRIVFTYGFVSGNPVPPGASRVTIELEAIREGTRLMLTHEFPTAAPRDEHVQGWRFHWGRIRRGRCRARTAGARPLDAPQRAQSARWGPRLK